tara:strand:+ start:2372 stop:3325 length:954 start_codon:yes stop_codon:yes gene_type:complete
MSKIRYIGLVLLVALGSYYFYHKSNELKQLMDLTLAQIGTASVFIMLSFLIIGKKYKSILSAFQVNLSAKEWLGLPQVIMLFNLILFKSGTIANAYYLKKHHRLSYSRFIVGMSSQKLLEFFAVSFVGFIFSLSLFIFLQINFYVVLIFCVLLLALLFLFLIPFVNNKKYDSRIIKKIIEVVELWNEFKQNKTIIIEVIALEIIAIFILGMRYYVAFNILNNPVGIIDCVIISIFVSITGYVSILPGNIGIREIVVGLSAYSLDYSFDYGVIATTLDRIIATIWFGIFGFIFFHSLHMKGYSKQSEIISDNLQMTKS